MDASLPIGCEPTCPGCRHRRLSPAASAAAKQAYLERALAGHGGRLAPIVTAPTGERLGYRQRVTLTAGWSGAAWRFGLVHRGALVPIPDCPVHAPRVNALARWLATRLPPPERFPLAYLQTAGGQATLVVKAKQAEPWPDGTPAGIDGLGVEGLWLNCSPSAGKRLFAKRGWRLLWGVEESRDALGLTHGPAAFLQPQPGLHRAALDEAEDWLAPAPGAAVLDLCSGHGASLARWRAAGADTLGIEASGAACALARRNAPGATVLQGHMAERWPQAVDWMAVHRPHGVYANPPRSGLEPRVLGGLCEPGPLTRLAYLSCSAGTLARDLDFLVRAGWRVERLTPRDFFPLTHHVEVLARLAREG